MRYLLSRLSHQAISSARKSDLELRTRPARHSRTLCQAPLASANHRSTPRPKREGTIEFLCSALEDEVTLATVRRLPTAKPLPKHPLKRLGICPAKDVSQPFTKRRLNATSCIGNGEFEVVMPLMVV